MTEHRLGIGLAFSMASCLAFSLAAAFVKLLASHIPSTQILVLRGVISSIFFTIMCFVQNSPVIKVQGCWRDLLCRGIFGSTAVSAIFLSYRFITLADATTLQFLGPILVIFCAFFILQESITTVQIVTSIISFIGAIFVTRPDFIFKYFDADAVDSQDADSGQIYGYFMALTCALTSALSMVWLRKLKAVPVFTIVLWNSVILAIVSSITLFTVCTPYWPLSAKDWALMLLVGFLGSFDQLCITMSFKYENAGVISVSRTITIVLAFIWDLVFFIENHKRFTTYFGASLVIFALIHLAVTRHGIGRAILLKFRAKSSEEVLPIVTK